MAAALVVSGEADTSSACTQARSEALLANRIVAVSQSYRKDNPVEYAKVRAYLDGGARPIGVTSHMGLHLVLGEDACRGGGGTTTTTTTTTSTTTTTTTTPPPPPSDCDPTSDPSPIAGLGYTVRFKDCFSTLDRSVWCDRQWWEGSPPSGSQSVTNGELRIRRARTSNYADTTLTTEPCGQANPQSFQYGYFEAKMKHETAQGNGPAFWLFSTAHATNPNWPNPKCPNPLCLSAELDVFEGFGTINYGGSRTDDFFSGTIHRNSCDCYGVSNTSRFVQHGTGLDMSQYHIYAARWTPTTVYFYIDGHLEGSLASFDSFAQPMHLLLYNWTTGWESENVPNASTQPELDVFVDWVRVWQQ